MEPKMDPKSIAVNGRRSTASSTNIHGFRALFLQIFLRLTDPPIFKNIGFTIVTTIFEKSAFRKNANTIPKGNQNHFKFDQTSCQKAAEIGSKTCKKGIPEIDRQKMT